MRSTFTFIVCLFVTCSLTAQKVAKEKSGNPVFPGWYADPEGVVFDKEYWIYPTYSDVYEKQVFLMLFHLPT